MLTLAFFSYASSSDWWYATCCWAFLVFESWVHQVHMVDNLLSSTKFCYLCRLRRIVFLCVRRLVRRSSVMAYGALYLFPFLTVHWTKVLLGGFFPRLIGGIASLVTHNNSFLGASFTWENIILHTRLRMKAANTSATHKRTTQVNKSRLHVHSRTIGFPLHRITWRTMICRNIVWWIMPIPHSRCSLS